MIAVVFALKAELKSILERACSQGPGPLRVFEAHVEHHKVLLLQTGIGERRALEGTRYLLQHYSPQALLCLGFAGGAVPELAPGDLVLAQRIYRLQDGAQAGPLESDPGLLALALQAAKARGLPFRCGGLLTVPHPVHLPESKEDLGKEFPIIALDMESYWVGQLAYGHRVPFLAVRSILDPVDQALPAFVDRVPAERMATKALVYALGHPLRLLELERWRKAMREARCSLEGFLRLWLRSYDPALVGEQE